MSQAVPTPFYVLDRPYVLWSHDIRSENIEFLDTIDTDFYHRSAQTAFFDESGLLRIDQDDPKRRKDIASLARLLWNHGLETLIITLGAYIQAPHAVHGFFLKCKNEDCRAIAQHLLDGQLPANNCLRGPDFTMLRLVKGIMQHAGWPDLEKTCEHFSGALTELLRQYADAETRGEYNSIKHGLRAHHGSFGFAVGAEDVSGVPAAPENMQPVGQSVDGSHFVAVKQIQGFTAKDARQQFSIEKVSLSWSLEKTLTELQMFSSLIANLVTALKIVAGTQPRKLKYFRPEVTEDWWEGYFQMEWSSLISSSIAPIISVQGKPQKAEKMAADFYRRSQQRKVAEDEASPL